MMVPLAEEKSTTARSIATVGTHAATVGTLEEVEKPATETS
jgi:hypothetical protein